MYDVPVVEVGHQDHAEGGEGEGEQLPVVGPCILTKTLIVWAIKMPN